MCGINIIINTINKPAKEALQAMQEATHHRGPDALNLFVHTNNNWHLSIGVNRLQVVDQDDNSNQPMVSSCGNYVLAYNGEVYNYQDLRNQLIAKRYQFKTDSDTEVVLYWLQEFGINGLADFKGMFALVFVDLAKKKMIAARDRQGIKPLFYYQTQDSLIISSSILAIESSGLAGLSINNNAIDDYLAYRHVMGTHTFYREIYSFEQGEAICYDEKLSTDITIISAPKLNKKKDLRSTLIETTGLLFNAPTTPGLMLSGGVDSTLLLAILYEELGINGLNTYTLGAGDDVKWAKQAAAQYESQHHEIPVSIDVLERMDGFLMRTDQPVADHGAFATWLVAEEAAKKGNILLSGAGADELFGGYNRHRAYNYYLKHQQQVLTSQKLITKLGLKALLPSSLRQFINGVDINQILTYHNFLQSYAINKRTALDDLWKRPVSLIDNLAKALDFDRTNYLVADVLAITDNSIMQHSVEARVPYLYDDIVSFANKIPVEEKIKNRGKDPLKDLLKGYGGLKYTKRKKQGFGLPMAEWLRDKNSLWLWGFLLKDSPIFEYVSKLRIYEFLELHQQGKKDNSMQLWSILVLEKWLSRFYK